MAQLLYVEVGPYQVQIDQFRWTTGNGPHLRERLLRDDEDTSAYMVFNVGRFMTVEARQFISQFWVDNAQLPNWRNDPSYDWRLGVKGE